MSMYYEIKININAIGTPNTIDNPWVRVGAAISAHIEALIMLFRHSKLIVSNEEMGLNSCAYRRCLSRIRINSHGR
jgi:hypothetical protein